MAKAVRGSGGQQWAAVQVQDWWCFLLGATGCLTRFASNIQVAPAGTRTGGALEERFVGNLRAQRLERTCCISVSKDYWLSPRSDNPFSSRA